MPVGSHKDAFKAHQLVKKLVEKDKNTVLAVMAADVLLDFVKSQRQINQREQTTELPVDRNQYDQERLAAALQAVGSLCGMCEEAHDDACFVNQARRFLIAARTGVDIGLKYDGKTTLTDLLSEAERLGMEQKKTGKDCDSTTDARTSVPADGVSIDHLQRELDQLREKDVFRSTLIDEVMSTIQKVAAGNFAAEMPVHDDEQLGKLATAFNLMLKSMQATMSQLDQMVAVRSAELKQIMKSVPIGLLSLNQEYRVNPEYSAAAERILGVESLRGRDFLDLLGLTRRLVEERKALEEYLGLLQMGLWNPDLERLNPCSERLLANGCWVRLSYCPLSLKGGASPELLVVLEDITETKKLAAQVETTQRESAQIKAMAEAPDVFREFLQDVRCILTDAERILSRDPGSCASEAEIDELFRGIHTIKGMAGSFGMTEVGTLAGSMENLLGRARKEKQLQGELLRDVHTSMAALKEAVQAVRRTAVIILGDDVEQTVPTMRVPLFELQQMEQLLKTWKTEEERQSVLQRIHKWQQIPARKALERVIRLVPGLINRLGKAIDFEVVGGDLLLPYLAAQALNAPLTHLLRNAFDHGIEDPETRRSKGKPETGKVVLGVRSSDQEYLISLEDDGRGLDAERLRESAVAKGLLSAAEAAVLTPDECLRLIFKPGFSTAATVTEVSGRGVGLDVVQTAIMALGGVVVIDTKPGSGTRFTLKLPRFF